MILLKNILLERFDNVSLLLLNPEYNDKTLDELLKDFKLDGGIVLGEGKYGIVLEHPKWNYVIKIFPYDNSYLKFVRLVIKNPKPSFPKFYDKPRKIIPNFLREKKLEILYVVKMEKLQPITSEELNDIMYYLYYYNSDMDILSKEYDNWKLIKEKVNLIEQKYPQIKVFAEDYNYLLNLNIGWDDIRGKNNIMKRSNGVFVLNDPVWEGTTAYQIYDKIFKSEIDYYGQDYDYNDENLIKGGQLYTPSKLKNKKHSLLQPKNDNENIPF